MTKQYVTERFIDSKGIVREQGDDAPDEPEDNLAHYARLGLIAGEVDYEKRYPGSDIGRRGRAEDRKGATKGATDKAAKPKNGKPATPAVTK